jgi:glycosyltransferase involved in cell wall biosynthesis
VIRYAVLTPSLAQPGGAERHIHALIAHADPSRLQCGGVILSGYGGVDSTLARAIRAHGVDIVGDPPKGAFFGPRPDGLVATGYRTLRQAVQEVSASVQVLVSWGSLFLGRYTEGLRIPVVCVSHCSERSNQPITGITHLVGVSRAATEFWGAVAHDLPMAILPNGVDIDHCVPRRGRDWQRAQWGLTSDQFVIGYVGRHHAVKRPGAVIRALPRLPARYVAVLIGNQPQQQNVPAPFLPALAHDLDVTARVRFEPFRTAMGDAYAAMDCLMLASQYEADSLTLKEAMICGLPVCATRVGSIPEIEEEFGTAVVPITDAGDAADLAGAVLRATVWDGTEIADRMRRVAWDRWTAPAMAERWTDYLEEIVATHRVLHPAPVQEP